MRSKYFIKKKYEEKLDIFKNRNHIFVYIVNKKSGKIILKKNLKIGFDIVKNRNYIFFHVHY